MAALTETRRQQQARAPRLEPAPLLQAVLEAGTSHVYADTADVQELGELIETDGGILDGIDGNTANQPLVRKVVDRYLEEGDPPAWARRLQAQGLAEGELVPHLYAVILARLAGDIVASYAAGRSWEVSLQIHMGLAEDAAAARRMGRLLRRLVPGALVKVPFAPHAPQCLLVARDLQREGIPVNFTSTFSARQAVAAAMLADVSRTNIFMGRLNQGLDADLLGEHVDLEAQRAIVELRRRHGVRTQLIVASVRQWQTFPRVAGCDVFTAPCDAIRQFLGQTDVAPGDVTSQLETSYEDRLGIGGPAREKIGDERIARLYRVEPELVEFLADLRSSAEYAALDDGELLYRRFDDAGFGDLFAQPAQADWQALRRGKLPDPDGDLVNRLPLDTLFTLHAHADFQQHQEAIDERIRAAVAGA